MRVNKEEYRELYREFFRKEEIKSFTESYKNVYTGVSINLLSQFVEAVNMINNFHSKITSPDSTETVLTVEDILYINGFPEFSKPVDIMKLSQELSVYSFFSFYCGGNYYHAINEYLRFGKTSCSGCFSMVKTLERNKDNILGFRPLEPNEVKNMINDVFCKYPTEDNIVLWRLVDTNNGAFKPFEIFYTKEYLEKGFLSCSSILENLLEDEEFQSCDLLLKLYVPQGTPSLYLNYISRRSNENEWLLPPGTTIKPISLPKKYKGKKLIECIIEVDRELVKKRDFYLNQGETHQRTYYTKLLEEAENHIPPSPVNSTKNLDELLEEAAKQVSKEKNVATKPMQL